MEWIASLFLTGYGQRSRTSFFNTCIKNNFGFWPINVERILNTKTRLNSHGHSTSFSCFRLCQHLLVKIQNYFLSLYWRRMFCFSDHNHRIGIITEVPLLSEPLMSMGPRMSPRASWPPFCKQVKMADLIECY